MLVFLQSKISGDEYAKKHKKATFVSQMFRKCFANVSQMFRKNHHFFFIFSDHLTMCQKVIKDGNIKLIILW